MNPSLYSCTEQVGHERGRRTDFEENTVRHQHEIFTYDLHSIFSLKSLLQIFKVYFFVSVRFYISVIAREQEQDRIN